MHIGFRTSGGRGEFELVGRHETLLASDLAGWSLRWELPGIGECETGLWVEPGDSGKPRLRSKKKNERPQVGRQIAAILLLPRPIRDRKSISSDNPVLKDRSYFLTKIGFKPTSIFDEKARTIVANLAYVWAENMSEVEIVNFDQRWNRVRAIHDSYMMDQSHVPLLSIIQKHQNSIEALNISRETVLLAEELYKYLGKPVDVVPTIEERFEIAPQESYLPAIEEIEEDDIEMRVMTASDMRLRRTRSSSAKSFSTAVRNAWRHTCAFCGLTLPGRKGSLDSGVDAAHILAWSEYDLDIVRNGICLCKLHHWAFDQHILLLREMGQKYFVEESPRMEAFDPSTQISLRTAVGPIPNDRLPSDTRDRPSREYIEKLNSDIDVSNLSY